MQYDIVVPATFLRRPNRFIAEVELDGKTETVHVKNTGRCKELLKEGSRVYLSLSDNPSRKTRYDLVAVEKQRDGRPALMVNMDSQIPNSVAYEWLTTCGIFSDDAVIRREVTYGNSRFDIYIEDGKRKAFIEVKGVTLENDGTAMFPDAPTERGIKHINELISAAESGYEAYILFVIQMKEVAEFRPNDATHKAFGDALRMAAQRGVRVMAVDCIVTPDTLIADEMVEVIL